MGCRLLAGAHKPVRKKVTGTLKMPACQSPTSKIRDFVDAGPGGIPHDVRFIFKIIPMQAEEYSLEIKRSCGPK